jgi:hypothetical protein
VAAEDELDRHSSQLLQAILQLLGGAGVIHQDGRALTHQEAREVRPFAGQPDDANALATMLGHSLTAGRKMWS